MYRTGHIADHDEVVKRRVALHHFGAFAAMMALASSLPMETTNRALMPPDKGGPGILDQHDTGSCEGHAHGTGGTLVLAGQGTSPGLISPAQLYLGALRFDATLQPDGTLSSVTDTGTMPSSILSAWQTFGAGLAKDDPQYPCSSGTLYKNPGDPNSVLILPPPERLYAASPFRFKGAYFITAGVGSPQRLLQALTTLASKRVITDAIPASGNDFQGYTGGIIGATTGPIDHANVIVDYKWVGSAADWATFTTALVQGNTTQVAALVQNLLFICVNSWSTSWGEGDAVSTMPGGMYRANIHYFDKAEDLCVLDLEAA
jgi:hypothetical protein